MQFIALLLISLVINHARGDLVNAGGYAQINTPSNGDPQSCILTLSAEIHTDSIVFTVFADDQHSDCTHQDIYFSSIFQSDPLPIANDQIVLTDTVFAHTQRATVNATTLFAHNQSSCILLERNLGNQMNEDWYQCRFRFSSIYFHVSFGYFPSNSSLDNTWYNVLLPHFGLQSLNQGMETILKQDMSSPQLVGMFYSQCGGWSNVITNLNTNATITGTIQQSQVVNLATYLISYSLNAIIIRQKNNANSYLRYNPHSPVFPFQHPGPGNCFNIEVLYSDMVPDLNYCSGGCLVTIMLQNGNVVLDLPTNGFTTKAPGSLRA